jgi:Putative amidoligase enzyme
MLNANEMSFGVEIEACMPIGSVTVGGYHRGIQIPGLPLGWLATSDSSICSPTGYTGCEVVSPILKGSAGLEQVKRVCEWLATIGAKVNSSTGLHVHIGWTGDCGALTRLTCDVANFEIALFASTGTHSRERNGMCKGVRSSHELTTIFKEGKGQRSSRASDRYHTLNVTNLGTNKNTVEFRCFAGTMNLVKITAYIRLCLGIVQRAVNAKRPANWNGVKVNAARAIYKGKGVGGVELTRLLFAMGWIKGDIKNVFGDLQADGLPTLDDCKKELFRLAAKYDGLTAAVSSAAHDDDVMGNG